ncbi:MAG: PAS domain-containing protein [Kiritimatiellae bacterium]|nr:PAS domain-containing protein [Kiritimatiellia bacterium]
MFEYAYDTILMTDFDGRILATNMRAVNFFGYERSDFPGMDIRSLIPGITDDLIQKIKKGGSCGQFLRIQAFAVHKSGADYSAVEIIPLGNKEDKASYICYLIRDIQSRYIAEENLLSTYHAMDNTDSGIGITNMEGILIYANRKMVELLGDGDIDQVINYKLNCWFDQKTVVNPILSNTLKGKGWLGEQCVVCKDKSIVLFVSAVPNINRDGELMGAVLSIRDMANERRAEIAEYQAERDRIMMESLAGVCHSIGQPATVLLTSLELLKLSGLDDKENVNQMLELCYDAVIQIRDLLYKMNAKQLYAAEPYLLKIEDSPGQEIVALESPSDDDDINLE